MSDKAEMAKEIEIQAKSNERYDIQKHVTTTYHVGKTRDGVCEIQAHFNNAELAFEYCRLKQIIDKQAEQIKAKDAALVQAENECCVLRGEIDVTLCLIGTHTDKDGYERCNNCGLKVCLVYPRGDWIMDSEPYKSGEIIDEEEREEIHVGEVTGHWCKTCNMLTSLTYNFP